MLEKPNKKILLLIYLLSVSIGLLFVIIKPIAYINNTEYEGYARNILSGNGFSGETQSPYYPDVYRTHGYSLFLAAIYLVFGINNFAVVLIQVLLNAAVCLFVFYIAKRYFSVKFSYIISIAVAIYPFTAMWVHVTYAETLCIFLFSLGLFLFENGREANKRIFFFLSGIAYGYCLLVRPGTALMPVFLTISYLLVSNFKKIWMSLIIFNLGVFLIWSPWIIRNYEVTKRFIPLTIEGSEIIYWATGAIGEYSENRLDNPKFANQMREIGQKLENSGLIGMQKKIKEEDLYLEYAIKNIKDNPFLYLWASIKRIPRMWISKPVSNNTGQSYGYKILGGNQFIFDLTKYFMIFYSLLAVYGIWIVRHKAKIYIFLLLPIVYFCLTNMFMYAEARYTLPGRPFVLIFSIIGLFGILKKPVVEQK